LEVLLKTGEEEIEDSSNNLFIKVVVSKTLIVIKDHFYSFIFDGLITYIMKDVLQILFS